MDPSFPPHQTTKVQRIHSSTGHKQESIKKQSQYNILTQQSSPRKQCSVDYFHLDSQTQSKS